MMKKYNKAAVTIVAAVMLVCLYSIIFGFSAQNGEQSGGLSHKVSETCVEVAHNLSGQHWTESFRQELILCLEHPIRKLAHFTEYALMGILVYLMWRPWLCRGKRLYVLIVVWVLLLAAGDEWHQTFVPGRVGSLADVLLDTCGGTFGMLVCILFEKMLRIVKNGK